MSSLKFLVYLLLLGCISFNSLGKDTSSQETPFFSFATTPMLRSHLDKKKYAKLELIHANQEAVNFFNNLDFTKISSQDLVMAKKLLQVIERQYRTSLKDIDDAEKRNNVLLEKNKDKLGEQAVEEYFEGPQRTMWRVKTNKQGNKIRVKDYAEINKVKREAIATYRQNIILNKQDAITQLQYWKTDCLPKNIPALWLNLISGVPQFCETTFPLIELLPKIKDPDAFIFVSQYFSLADQESQTPNSLDVKKDALSEQENFLTQFTIFLDEEVFQALPYINLFIQDGTNVDKRSAISFLNLFKIRSLDMNNKEDEKRIIHAQKIFTELLQITQDLHKKEFLILKKRYPTKKLHKYMAKIYQEQITYFESSKLDLKLSSTEISTRRQKRQALITQYLQNRSYTKGSSVKIYAGIDQILYAKMGDYQLPPQLLVTQLPLSFKGKELLSCEKLRLETLLLVQAYRFYDAGIKKNTKFSFNNLKNFEEKMIAENWKKVELYKETSCSEKDFLSLFNQQFLPAIYQLEIFFQGDTFYQIPFQWQGLLLDIFQEKKWDLEKLTLAIPSPQYVAFLQNKNEKEAILAILKEYPDCKSKIKQWLKIDPNTILLPKEDIDILSMSKGVK